MPRNQWTSQKREARRHHASLKECWTRAAQWHHRFHTEKPIDFAKNAETLQKREAQANRADTSILTLCSNLLECLTYVLRETWNVRSSLYHAIEQAQSLSHASQQTQSQKHDEDCENIVFDTIASESFFVQTFYDEPALLLHKQMWDIMSRNKEGLAKENMFIEWCRRVQRHTEAASTASPSTATEHVFKSLALDLLSNDLKPEQRNDISKIIKDEKTGEIHVTTKQRSWINSILRKNLGHARVAFYIFKHGVPDLFNLPFRRQAPTRALLQSMLQDFMTWHASLLYSILRRPNHPGRANARMLAALGQTEWWMHRREQKVQVEQVKDQRAKVEKDKDFKKTKDKVTKVTKHHKQENEKEKDKVRISSSTTISSSTRSSSSTGISKETVEHQAQKKQKMEQVLLLKQFTAEKVEQDACFAATTWKMSSELPSNQRNQWDPSKADQRLPMTHEEAEAKRAALAPPAAGKRIRSSSKTRAEALQERDLNSRLAAVDEYVGTLDDEKLENLKDTLNQIFRAGKVKLVPRGSASSSCFSTEEKLDSFADEIREIAKEHRLDVVIISDIAKRDRQKRRRKRKH